MVADGAEESRLAAVRRAVETWKRQLIDLTGRNRLIYYRPLRKGTLELGEADDEALARLLAGTTVRLSDLFDAERRPAEAAKARTIYRRTREHAEERGVATLFVAHGMATWTTTSTSATPNAPVLLCHAQLLPKGSAAEDFDLELVGEWQVNEALLMALAADFHVAAVPDWLLGEEDDDAAGVYDRLMKACEDVPDFSITDTAVLGNFAYTKMPMVRDLEEAVDALADHDLIAAIAGDSSARDLLGDAQPGDPPIDLPDRTPPADEWLVRDADASQNRVINAAVDGGSMVAQGPPGTGKSQTIANLIAAFAARGRRVLFVAEKRAAIDAVTKRLDEVGLEDLVLDLHTGTMSKREFARQLAGSLHRSSVTPAVDESKTHAELETARQRLLEHLDALHADRMPFGVTVFDAQGRVLKLTEQRDPPLATARRWRGSQLDRLDGDTRRQAIDLLAEWARLGVRVRDGSSPWALSTITTAEQVDQVVELLDRLLADEIPALHAASAALDDTVTGQLTVTRASETAVAFDLAAAALAWVTEQAYGQDMAALATALAPAGEGGWARFKAQLSDSEYREAKKAVKAVWAADGRPDAAGLLEAASAAVQARQAWQAADLKPVPPVPPDGAEAFEAAAEQLAGTVYRLTKASGIDLSGLDLDELERQVGRLLDDRTTLTRLPRLSTIDQWCRDRHLGRLLDDVVAGQVADDDVVDLFDLTWHQSVLDHVQATDERLAEFDGRWHDAQVDRFVTADRTHRDTTPARIRRALAEAIVTTRTEHPEQDQLVRAEASKKQRHRPVREVMSAAPDVLLAVRPCWAMSPLLVSQLLPATQLFDVVVFDEASQVLPADAIPALLRAPQAIVAGDEHQLPPTTFFAGLDDGDDEEDEDEGPDGVALTDGYESILDVLGAMLPQRWLTWHYRSEDERLIAFCNRHVYQGSLTTFPGVGGITPLEAINVQQRGGDTRSDPAEIARVVDLLVDHARTRPRDTVGVIAMSQYHASRIEEGLRLRLVDEADPDLDAFFSDDHDERPFIKNIERVQGDERDRIVLATSYAKQPDGRLLNRLGPINHQVGYRRLNVAFSRARRQLTAVSSFTAADMSPDRFSSRGATMLRDWLRYVDSGGDELGGGELTPLNPFELSVLTRLEAAGLDVVPQWGVSGFRIDFAVRHPHDPTRFLLAVEADGATYHSTQTARDRDRLRQQLLERLGWQFVRIWSTDYFRDPDAEVARVVAAVDTAFLDIDRDVPIPPGTQQPARAHETPQRGPRPWWVPDGPPISQYTHGQLRELIDWIMSDTLLRTDDELLAEAMDELGFQKRGKNIVAAIQSAIDGYRQDRR